MYIGPLGLLKPHEKPNPIVRVRGNFLAEISCTQSRPTVEQLTGETTTSKPGFPDLVNKSTVLLRSPDRLITCSRRKDTHARVFWRLKHPYSFAFKTLAIAIKKSRTHRDGTRFQS